MASSPQPAGSREPIPLHHRALEDLSFIRDTMARAGTVTSVPGWGGVAMGGTALVASWIASRQGSGAEWLAVWLAEAVLALGIGGVAMVRKAAASRAPLLNRAGKLFLGSFAPPIVAGAALTPVFYRAGLVGLLPGLWMLLYGAAVAAAGAFSIRVVPLLGVSFMALGVTAFLLPPEFGNLLMAAGFGGLQIGFGLLIARKHGG
jgi:hypothetical protein